MNKKISRNSLCPCGSGKKYKRCCISKETPSNPTLPISVDDALHFAKWGLEQEIVPSSETKHYKVKTVELINRTGIVCKYETDKETSTDIKIELQFIASFLFAFSNDNPAIPFEVSNISVQAFSEDDEELMYSVSSRAALQANSEGNTIAWLNGTTFQDNSDEHRLIMAKTKISKIENALRELIVQILSDEFGDNWWSHIQKKIRENAEYGFENQTSSLTQDGNELIHYTYLNDTQKIIDHHQRLFTKVFPNINDLKDKVIELNKLRRDEGHNRTVSSQTVQKLEVIYNWVMSKISTTFPEITVDYLTDYWKEEVIKITSSLSNNEASSDPRMALLSQIRNIKNAISQLNSLLIPPGKENRQKEIIAKLGKYCEALALIASLKDSATKEEIDSANNIYSRTQKEFSEFTKELALKGL